VSIELTADERALIIAILQDRTSTTRKKGLAVESAWISRLLDKVIHSELRFSINDLEFLKYALENCTPEDLRRSCGAHEVAREWQVLKAVTEKLREVHMMS